MPCVVMLFCLNERAQNMFVYHLVYPSSTIVKGNILVSNNLFEVLNFENFLLTKIVCYAVLDHFF